MDYALKATCGIAASLAIALSAGMAAAAPAQGQSDGDRQSPENALPASEPVVQKIAAALGISDPTHITVGQPRRGYAVKTYQVQTRSGERYVCEIQGYGVGPIGIHSAATCKVAARD